MKFQLNGNTLRKCEFVSAGSGSLYPDFYKHYLKYRVYYIKAGTDVFVSNVFASACARVSSFQRNATFHTEIYFAFYYAVPLSTPLLVRR